ncbi:cupin domain-containing protein [Micromonospora haikouensis]|uniref:Cupin domain n=1 Tax=Micromonospora haikouensis TaxID=686309 RepID=A0A1C4WVZ1_9ACTN|nr:cupin domain-containing protein [Micromonospora haikouensis]SCF00426.1 Cupin domain [Micromonospora haikouensis]
MVNLPNGVGVSGLEVYPWAASDGCHGGSPHLHTACTEAYVVVGGRGELHTLTPAGPATTPLLPGTVAWFTPGTVHRAVNLGGLRVVVIMENSGLPEAGDAVLTFPPEILADPAAYAEAASLGPEPADSPAAERRARHRRDLAVRGYLAIRRDLAAGDTSSLRELYRAAVSLTAPRTAAWHRILDAGPAASLREVRRRLRSLADGSGAHLAEANVRVRTAPEPDQRPFGMCGRLSPYRAT